MQTIFFLLMAAFGIFIVIASVRIMLNSAMEESRRLAMDEVKSCLSFLVNRGADVVLDSKHLYKSGNKYVILVFDKNSNMIRDDEERFDNEDEAIERFVELTGGKLVDDAITTEN